MEPGLRDRENQRGKTRLSFKLLAAMEPGLRDRENVCRQHQRPRGSRGAAMEPGLRDRENPPGRRPVVGVDPAAMEPGLRDRENAATLSELATRGSSPQWSPA